MADTVSRYLVVISVARMVQRRADDAWKLVSPRRLVGSKPISVQQLEQLVLDAESAFVVSLTMVVSGIDSAGKREGGRQDG